MIYLVEDDESIRELVVYTLKSQGMGAKGLNDRPCSGKTEERSARH